LLSLQIPTAEVFEPLLHPARYKGAWGGRGSGKSHFFGEMLVDDAICNRGLRAVCIREVQKTLKQSSKKLIEDKILSLKLGEANGFKVFREVIETPGDGLILFQGMQDHTADSIKSLEGFDRAWTEEAQTLSHTSLKLLRPTIRAEGSELWFSWNPRRKTDPVDVLLRQGTRPTDSTVVNANWSHNPWFPDVLTQERIDCLNNEPEEYPHIWDGDYSKITKGAYFAKHIIKAKEEGRISKVAADPLMTIRLFVDIGGTGGKSDAFSIWAAQFIGKEIRVINYYEAQGQPIGTHLAWMRANGYTPDMAAIWLPHDGGTNDRVYDVSYESALIAAGYDVTVIPNQGKGAAMARIEEVRRLFPRMWFDEQKCGPGIDALGWYHEKKDEVRNIGLGPEHDWASHGADAFGLMCVAHEEPTEHKDIDFSSEW
jgi:phage terminase large subunit